MKEGIHPNYQECTVCSKSHSFYTGQQKAAAARGRIDKFNRKYGVKAAE